MTAFTSLLIANRGEIAVRIIRTARAEGLRAIAVYSDADADAPHVKAADGAVRIGSAPAAESHLNIENILAAAKETGAEAIHPGYGFLSENAAFARAVEKAGLVFVGPPAEAIEIMGDKARAKQAMLAAGVPCVPGYQDEDQSDDRLIAEAEAIGLPVMIKAAAGGGGRGMRLVTKKKDLADAIGLARSEAENAFGSGALIVEKAIARARHVEIQVFADAHGNAIHLGERDCSVQRRHQKVIEEAPAPGMTPELRAAMGAAAVEAARAVDYRGAGTVEFLLDGAGDFYFLEMNTRLQVEHPVTEEVTGLDLVALQLKVARGELLGIAQEDVTLTGHAIEARLYAEDPAAGFLPSTGAVRLWRPPAGEGVRVDAGVATGGEMSAHYDPMAAKIIARGATREEARRRLVAALEESALFGPATNRDFLIDALEQPAFAKGEVTTDFIAETYAKNAGDAGFAPPPPSDEDLVVAAVVQTALAQRRAHAAAVSVNAELLGWSSTGALETVRIYTRGEGRMDVRMRQRGRSSYEAATGDRTMAVEILEMHDASASIRIDGRLVHPIFLADGERALDIAVGPRTLRLVDLSGGAAADAAGAGGGRVVAPMHGKLIKLLVAKGDAVKTGDAIAVLEAMKMQLQVVAEIDGTVAETLATAGAQIAAGDVIAEIAPAEGSPS